MTRLSRILLAVATVAFWSVLCMTVSWQNIQSKILNSGVTPWSNATDSWLTANRLEMASPGNRRIPLLTLFTTFKEAPERYWIQMNTILNWELMYPKVQPLLFSTDVSSNLSQTAREHHWMVLPVPAVSSFGTPYFKEMYYSAISATKSYFFAYANADILFTPALVDTLLAVNRTYPNKTTLVMGRRINIIRNYTSDSLFYKPDEILKYAITKGQLYRIDAEDYFAIGNIHNFPWRVIKDVVIGRPAYDNYVVAMACRYNVSVIDATNTIKALHLSGGTVKFAGSNNKDRRYNFKVIGRFPWGKGMTTAVPLYTMYRKNGELIVTRRGKKC